MNSAPIVEQTPWHMLRMPWGRVVLWHGAVSEGHQRRWPMSRDLKEELHGKPAVHIHTFRGWAGWGPERSSNLLKISELLSEKGEIQIQVCRTWKPINLSPYEKGECEMIPSEKTHWKDAHTSLQLETLRKIVGYLCLLFFNMPSLLLTQRRLFPTSRAQRDYSEGAKLPPAKRSWESCSSRANWFWFFNTQENTMRKKRGRISTNIYTYDGWGHLAEQVSQLQNDMLPPASSWRKRDTFYSEI